MGPWGMPQLSLEGNWSKLGAWLGGGLFIVESAKINFIDEALLLVQVYKPLGNPARTIFPVFL